MEQETIGSGRGRVVFWCDACRRLMVVAVYVTGSPDQDSTARPAKRFSRIGPDYPRSSADARELKE
jgi:hypothetical protein